MCVCVCVYICNCLCVCMCVCILKEYLQFVYMARCKCRIRKRSNILKKVKFKKAEKRRLMRVDMLLQSEGQAEIKETKASG